MPNSTRNHIFVKTGHAGDKNLQIMLKLEGSVERLGDTSDVGDCRPQQSLKSRFGYTSRRNMQ